MEERDARRGWLFSIVSAAPSVSLFSLAVALLTCQPFTRDATLVVIASLSPESQQAAYEQLQAQAGELGVACELKAVPYRLLQESVFAFDPENKKSRWDLALVPASWLERLGRQRSILEVPIQHVQQLQRAVVPLAMLAVAWGESTWGYPMALDAPALIYNPALVPTPPTTLAAVARLAVPEGVLPLAVDLADLDAVLPLLAAAQGLDNPQDLKDLGQAWDRFVASVGPALAYPGALSVWLAPNAQAAQAQLFAEGKLAAFVGGAQADAILDKVGVPRSVVPLPPPCDRCPQPRPWARCIALVVSSSCAYPDLAQALAEKLASSRRNVAFSAATGMLPVLGGQETTAFLLEDPDKLGFLRALGVARLAPPDPERMSLATLWEAKFLHLNALAKSEAIPPRRAAR